MKQKNKKHFIDALVGTLIGFVNGFMGSGGGMLAVPVLEKSKKLEEKKAHATALAVILPLAIISGVIYSVNFEIDWIIALVLSVFVCIGGIIGSLLLKKLNNKTIRIIFSVLMAFAGVWIIIS